MVFLCVFVLMLLFLIICKKNLIGSSVSFKGEGSVIDRFDTKAQQKQKQRKLFLGKML